MAYLPCINFLPITRTMMVCLVIVSAVCAGAVDARSPATSSAVASAVMGHAVAKQTLQLVSGKWSMLSLEDDFDRVSIGDPETVDVAMVRLYR